MEVEKRIKSIQTYDNLNTEMSKVIYFQDEDQNRSGKLMVPTMPIIKRSSSFK